MIETIIDLVGFVVFTVLPLIIPNHGSKDMSLNEKDRDQVLYKFNDTKAKYPKDKVIHELFEEQVEKIPNDVAVVFENKKITYKELNERSNQLARILRERNIKPDQAVGLMVDISIEMIIGMISILKAGGAFLPIDPEYPKDRIKYMSENSNIVLLLTQTKVKDKIHFEREIINLENKSLFTGECSNLAKINQSEDLVYICYTSGSTGNPKGVQIQHNSLVNQIFGLKQRYNFNSSLGHILLAPFTFDPSVQQIFLPLISGGKLFLISKQIKNELPELLDFIVTNQIDIINTVPSIMNVLLNHVNNDNNLHFKYVILAGEVFPKNLYLRLKKSFSVEKIINIYGPTEATINTTLYECKLKETNSTIPIGKPLMNYKVLILNEHQNLVPIGVPGEIYISGVGLARGYVNNPELTAEKFIINPFMPCERMYRTGDLARWLTDGNIEFLGRVDQQVKIHGIRIELGEVEAALGQHPAVRETVVVAREDIPNSKRLVAYVVPNQEQTPTTGELRLFLKQKLPDHMVPSAFIMLDALPLTPNSKVDRRLLPVPDTTRPKLKDIFIAPNTPIEETLANIWEQVLGISQVGVHDNFFDLGGDSLVLLQLVSRANQMGFRLTVKQLFQCQTISELVGVISTTPTVHAAQDIVTGPIPITPSQYRFLVERKTPTPHHWNVSELFEVRQPLTPELMEQVVQQLLTHHDALRLRFVQTDSKWQQFNAGITEAIPFENVDLSSLPESKQWQAIEVAATKLQASLNLSEGPIVRVMFFNLGAQKSRLLVVVHQLAIDAISSQILKEDFQTALYQLSHSQTIKLPPKTTSFKQWAERLTKYAQSTELRQELKYWLSLPWSRFLRLPVDYPGGNNTNASSRFVSVKLSAEETRTLMVVSSTHHTQLNEVLLIALAQTLAQWLKTNTVLVDLVRHGRETLFEDLDLSRTIGFFISYTPVFFNLDGISHSIDVLKSVKEQLRYIPNGGIGYDLLRLLNEDQKIKKKMQALPRAEVQFNYLGHFDQIFDSSENTILRPAKESIGPTHSPRGIRYYPLSIIAGICEDQINLNFVFSKNLHRFSTIKKLSQNFVESLHKLINNFK